jgi:putative endonuclease
MYYVYILKNLDNTYYIGYTGNLEQRVNDHISGRSKWTSRKKNWELCYKESYETRSEAMAREKALKRLKNKKVIEQIIRQSTDTRA